MASPQPAGTPESHEWMFKLGDLLLGPVSGKALIQKLYDGEVTRETPVAPPGGSFRRLGEIETFRVHLAKAEAKLRVHEEHRAATKTRTRSRNAKLIVTLLAMTAGVIGAIFGAQWLYVNKPWKAKSDIAMPDITVDLPEIKVASASKYAESEVSLPDTATPHPSSTSRPGPRTPAKLPPRPAGTAVASASHPGAEAEISRPQYDSGAINEVVNSNKKTLFPCLVDEVRRRPGFAAKIPIEFAVGNDGHVAKLWIDHPEFKGESNDLYKCMFARLQQWKFPTYQGERATVSLAFNIGSPH
jgi:hypothetical protein